MNSLGELIASARVSAAGAFVGTPDGFSAIGLAANVFTLTIAPDRIIDNTMSVLKVTSENSTIHQCATQTNDNTVEVRGQNAAGAPADGAFWIGVFRRGVS